MTDAAAAAARAQRAAADPSASVFVTANAGSGKTKVLIDRIARLLLSRGAEPDQFLCITYTKAAAAEMQRRLFERLGGWCVAADDALLADLGKLLGADLAASPPLLVREHTARARALFARALETPGGLRIQTIHAFCERLLARFPLEAEAPPGFAIADEAESAARMREAWAAIAAEPAHPAYKALERFAERLGGEALERLFAALAKRRNHLRDFAGPALPAALSAIARRHGDPGEPEAIERELLDHAPWEAIRAALTHFEERNGAGATIAACIRAALVEPSARSYSAIFHTLDGEPRSPKALGLAKAEPWLQRLFAADGEAGRVAALTARFTAAERCADARAALTLGVALAEGYAAALSRAGALDFDDLIEASRRLLSGGDAAAWVLYKLDGGIAHVLIDEGQDTSPAQWDLLAPLQEEFFAGAGARGGVVRTVFAVGDPKQSIYSFQGADPARFESEAQRLEQRARAAGRAFSAPELTTSFRSTPEVLACVDAVFAHVALAGAAPEVENLVRHKAARASEPGLVEWWPIAPHPDRPDPEPWDAPKDHEPADSALARLARELAVRVRGWIEAGEGVWERGALRPMRPGDVMALVRARGRLYDQLGRAFKRAGLPVAGADRLVLTAEPAVQDLMAALRAAVDPADDLALACLLKGPLIGLWDDDADLFPLAHGRGRGERLIDRLRAATDPRHRAAAATVEAIIAGGGRAPHAFLAGLLESVDEAGRAGRAKIFARLGPDSADAIDELLARALAAPRAGATTLTAFLAALETDQAQLKREMEHAGDAVRILTVHGAKGLEAPVVLLPDTVDAPKRRSDDGLFFDEGGLPLYSPSAKTDDAAAEQLAARAAAAAEGEHARLLYVALTRARDRLLVCGHAKGPGAGAAREGSWHLMVERGLAACAEPIDTPFGPGLRLVGARPSEASPPRAEPETPAAGAATPPRWARTPVEAAAPVLGARPSFKPAALRRFGQSADHRFARGLLLHSLLERLPEHPQNERRERGRALLAARGLEGEAAEALIAEALAVLAAPQAAAAFGPDARAEVPVVGMVDGAAVQGVIDRLVVTATEALIVDFKSDAAAPAEMGDIPELYVRQLAVYAALVRQALPGRTVRCALYYTAHGRWLDVSAEHLRQARVEE